MFGDDTLYSDNLKKNKIKEVMQEVVLCGLSRAGFFDSAAFYGGTALRIFYGLDRFSEDLDFSLKTSNPDFDFTHYINLLDKEIKSLGLNLDVSIKEKTNKTMIESAFLKANTREHFLMFYKDDGSNIDKESVIKVKLEVDINPPDYATFETKFKLIPIPYSVLLYDKSSLFSGKLHAVICRAWTNRIKGRDFYDFIFYLKEGIPFNLKHLEARLKQTKHIDEDKIITLEDIKIMLNERFSTIDFELAKNDVRPFLKDDSVLDLWSEEFFRAITEDIVCI